jgi:hypothetical protein
MENKINFMKKNLYLALLAMSTLACGAQVENIPIVEKITWSSKINQQTKAIPLKAYHQQELWVESESAQLDDAQKIEDLLATVNLLGNINSTANGWKISMAKHSCEWQVSPADSGLKNQRKSMCLDQLSASQNQMLETAKQRILITCQADETPIDLLLEASSLAVALQKSFVSIWTLVANQKCGQAQRHMSFKIEDLVSIQQIQIKDGLSLVYSKGMQILGQEEIGLLAVSNDKIEKAKSQVLAMCDDAIRNEQLFVGKEISSGASKGILVPYAWLKDSLKIDAKNIAENADSMLIVSHANGDIHDWESQKKITFSFTLD